MGVADSVLGMVDEPEPVAVPAGPPDRSERHALYQRIATLLAAHRDQLTPRRPARDRSFDRTWKVPGKRSKFYHFNYIYATALGLLHIGCLAIGLRSAMEVAAGLIQMLKNGGSAHSPDPATVVVLLLCVAGILAVAGTTRSLQRGLRARLTPWTLRITSKSIIAGDHTLPWHTIEAVRLGRIRTRGAWYRLEGLHVRLRPGAQPPPVPAGWPAPAAEPAHRADRWVPICVLGPLTSRQRASLTRALAHNAGRRWYKTPI